MKIGLKSSITKTWIMLLISAWLYSNGQSVTFINKIASENNQCVNAAIEIPGEGYIFAVNETINGKSVAKLMKTNLQGDTTLFQTLDNTDDLPLLDNIVKVSENTYLGIGFCRNYDYLNNSLWIITFNNELQILSEKKYAVPYSVYNTSYCIDQFNHLIINGWYDHTDTNGEDIFLFKITMEGDSLSYQHMQYPGMQITFSIMEKMDSTGYYMPIWGRVNSQYYYLANMLELDYDFNITSEDSITNDVGFLNNIRKFNDHQFLISGQTWVPTSTYNNEFIAVEKLETNYHAASYQRISPYLVDTTSYCARYRNLDFIDTNAVYSSGTVNYNLNWVPEWKSYFVLANLNSTLEIRWKFFYGFDRYYSLQGILATTDGGCLLYGAYCDYISPYSNINNLILIKTDSTGLVTGTSAYPQFKVSNAILFPNPGTDFLNIQSGPQISGAQFTLYDMQGRPVLQENINTTQLRLPTSNLPAGTYPWQIVFKNKVIESGKWVKAGGE
jgi:hypothetical protein